MKDMKKDLSNDQSKTLKPPKPRAGESPEEYAARADAAFFEMAGIRIGSFGDPASMIDSRDTDSVIEGEDDDLE